MSRVDRITLSYPLDGATLERQGHSGNWALARNGQIQRHLNEFECEFVNGAMRRERPDVGEPGPSPLHPITADEYHINDSARAAYERVYVGFNPAGFGSFLRGYQMAHAEMLDMLGREHPWSDYWPRADGAKERAYERIKRAVNMQQPYPVPDQAAIVWRVDLMKMRYDLIHKQACFDDYARVRAELDELRMKCDRVAKILVTISQCNEHHTSSDADMALSILKGGE